MFFGAVAFSAVGAFFMVNVQMPSWAFIVSGVSIVFFATPAVWAVVKWLKWRNGIILLTILGAYALVIESIGVKTGFPYGSFSYSDLLGFRLFDAVPWSIAFAWAPLILAAFTIAKRFFANLYLRVLIAALLLISFDLVIDPGAVYLGFWKYDAVGNYYGVPFINFVGWLLSGVIGAGILESVLGKFRPKMPPPAKLLVSAHFTIIFWTMIALWAGLIFPFIIGFALTSALLWFYFLTDISQNPEKK